MLAAQGAPPQSANQPSSSDQSVAAAARDAKAQKTSRAKKVFTDEDMEVMAGPLPRLNMEGADNSGEVIDAILRYRATHTPEETEKTVHAWFDRYDGMLRAAIQQNANIMSVRNANTFNAYDLCQENQDPQECRRRETTDFQWGRSDSTVMVKNSQLQSRLTQLLMEVRTGLMPKNIHYDWFKIRNPTGGDI